MADDAIPVKAKANRLWKCSFLADVHLTCEVCGGKRFKEEVLEVTYKGKNIYDVLEMSVDEAIEFFLQMKESDHCKSHYNLCRMLAWVILNLGKAAIH